MREFLLKRQIDAALRTLFKLKKYSYTKNKSTRFAVHSEYSRFYLSRNADAKKISERNSIIISSI